MLRFHLEQMAIQRLKLHQLTPSLMIVIIGTNREPAKNEKIGWN